MEVILLKDVASIGKAGQTLRVKDGYGRNFLLARGLAVQATQGVRAQVQKSYENQRRHAELSKAKAQEQAQGLEKISCSFPVTVGEQGMHGAVTVHDIMTALNKLGFAVEKNQILLDRPITHIGSFSVPVKLHPDVTAALRVLLVQKQSV